MSAQGRRVAARAWKVRQVAWLLQKEAPVNVRGAGERRIQHHRMLSAQMLPPRAIVGVARRPSFLVALTQLTDLTRQNDVFLAQYVALSDKLGVFICKEPSRVRRDEQPHRALFAARVERRFVHE